MHGKVTGQTKRVPLTQKSKGGGHMPHAPLVSVVYN